MIVIHGDSFAIRVFAIPSLIATIELSNTFAKHAFSFRRFNVQTTTTIAIEASLERRLHHHRGLRLVPISHEFLEKNKFLDASKLYTKSANCSKVNDHHRQKKGSTQNPMNKIQPWSNEQIARHGKPIKNNACKAHFFSYS